jgi:hypothetical protein
MKVRTSSTESVICAFTVCRAGGGAARNWQLSAGVTKRPDSCSWEYKLVSMGNPLEPDVALRANVLGTQGWELITPDAGVWIFNRPAADEDTTGALEAIIEQTVPMAESEGLLRQGTASG